MTELKTVLALDQLHATIKGCRNNAIFEWLKPFLLDIANVSGLQAWSFCSDWDYNDEGVSSLRLDMTCWNTDNDDWDSADVRGSSAGDVIDHLKETLTKKTGIPPVFLIDSLEGDIRHKTFGWLEDPDIGYYVSRQADGSYTVT